MKKFINIFLLLVLLIFTLSACGNNSHNSSDITTETNSAKIWDGTIASAFENGIGTKESPYEIANPPQLAFFAKTVNEGTTYSDKHIVLTNDIDLNNIEWTPIGNGINSFEGCFDGNEKAIKNLKITSGVKYNYEFPKGKKSTYCSFGFFATIQNAEVKNLLIDNAEIMINLSDNVISTHAGILCGGLRTYDTSSTISNIKIQNSIISTDCAEYSPSELIIGGAIGHIYSSENTNTDIDLLETNITVSFEDGYGSVNNVGAIIGRALIDYSDLSIENSASYLNLKISKEQCYYTFTKNIFGAIGTSQASKKPFSIKNMFSKLTITAPQNNVGAYPTAYIANAILGDAHYFALKDDPTAIGYNFENVFGCVTQINAETNEETTLTTLYDLPEGPNFSQLNCQGCESLPENHNLDKEIWDISDLSNPKLR